MSRRGIKSRNAGPLIGLCLCVCVACLPSFASDAQQGPSVVEVEQLASLPADIRHPEGLTADPATGMLYVGTFDARVPEAQRNNRLLRYARDGRLLATRGFGATPITGLAFREEHVYLLNFGASKLQRLPADFGPNTAIEDVATFTRLTPSAPTAREIDNPDGSRDRIDFGSNGLPGINGMTFDLAGNLYVSDSFQGAIYRIASATTCKPCQVETISRDPLLGTANAALPFGANGLAFDQNEQHLYITNAGDGRLLRMTMPHGAVTVVAESLPGADGLVREGDLYWVAANQADTVLGIDAQGRTRVHAGAFHGIDGDGAPIGLLFPASTAVDGDWMVVVNLALPLTAAQGDEWEESATRWTLSRFAIPRRNSK